MASSGGVEYSAVGLGGSAEDREAQDINTKVSGGKVLSLLMHKDTGELRLSKSVYDAAIVIPQISRSAGNPKTLIHLLIRSYLWLALNYFLQSFILYMIAQEEFVMDKFAGQMHLCDFGAGVEDCPNGVNCIGPGGTNYQNAGRMYSWDAYITRTFVRDSLVSLYPEQESLIREQVDPGEYGVENYWVRLVCVFIFMMSVMSDLLSSVDMIRLLYHVPSKAEPWLDYEVPTWGEKEHVKEKMEKGELDFVSFRSAGMPMYWKIINGVFIIFPKLFIWRSTAMTGVMFLMETAGIEDVIVNVTALTFILNLDEMIFFLFEHKAVHHMLDQMEPFVIGDVEIAESHTPEQAMKVLQEDIDRTLFDPRFLPWKPILSVLLTWHFVWMYYSQFCTLRENGARISKPQSLPASQVFPLTSFWFPFLVGEDDANYYWRFKAQK